MNTDTLDQIDQKIRQVGDGLDAIILRNRELGEVVRTTYHRLCGTHGERLVRDAFPELALAYDRLPKAAA